MPQQISESPRLVQRRCGGWLALAPEGATLKIGVSADSEGEARDKYRTTVDAWKATLALADVAESGECAARRDVIDTRA